MLECSLGGFRAEGRTVLGKAQASRVEASQGFYCLGFIQPIKQTNMSRRSVVREVCGDICWSVLWAVFVLKAEPSWIKLKRHEWKHPRGFTVRVLSIKQTNKQTLAGIGKLSGRFSC